MTHMPSRIVSPSRIDWVDYAKGWCIVLVVMMHSTLGVGDALGGEGFMHSIVAWARPFRMPDFFLISGLFLARTIDLPWRSYVDRKVLHFLYFFVVWTLIQLVVKKGWLLFGMQGAFFGELGLAFIEPYGTLWFIYLLPVFFILVKALRFMPGAALLLLAASGEIAVHATGWTSGYVMIDEFLARFVYFCAGYLFARHFFALARLAAHFPRTAIAALILWAGLNAALVLTPAHVLPDDWTPAYLLMPDSDALGTLAMLPGISLLAGLLGCSAIIVFSSLLASARKLQILRYLGEHSIVIYLAFFLPMAATRTVLVEMGMSSIGLKSLIVTIVAIVVPLLIYRVLRDTPAGSLFWRPYWARLGAAGQGELRRQPA